MDLSMLNPPQREAVLKTEGPLLILAGAGSGKTRVLTHRIAYLIEELGVYPGNILAITFTNKAAKEMKYRVEDLLGRFTDIWVSTFHSSCVRILRRDIDKVDYTRDFVIYDGTDQKVVIKECYKELNINDKLYPIPMVLSRISEAKDKMFTPREFDKEYAGDFQMETIGKIYRLYQKKLKKNNALDFDDLIFKTVELFEKDKVTLGYYQNKFQYIMVDEYQDTNQLQYKLISMLAAKHGNLCVVGDDDQCIVEGCKVDTKSGKVSIEEIKEDDEVLCASGQAETMIGTVEKKIKKEYKGSIVKIKTKSGKEIKGTPNHIGFARLNPQPGVHYVYLMYKKGYGYRIGQTQGVRSRKGEITNGLAVRLNQEHADKMWILKVCFSKEEACYYEQLYAFKYGIPTTVFHGNGRRMALFQEHIDKIFKEIDTEHAAVGLMNDLCIFEEYPHHLCNAVIRGQSIRRIVNVTSFGGKRTGVDAGWYAHRIGFNTSGEALREKTSKKFPVRDGQRNTWRVETERKEYDEAYLYARDLAGLDDSIEIVKKARLTEGKSFFYMPLAHMKPTMSVAIYEDGKIIEDLIEEVVFEDYDGYVYDLSVPHLRQYICEGIVVHNSIYSWRGADIRNILNFEDEFSNATVIKLEQNYRSTQNILDAANCVIKNNRGRKSKKLWTSQNSGDVLRYYRAENEHDEARFVVSQIKDMVDTDGRNYSEFAMLYRTNAQSRVIEDSLMKAGIPYRIYGGLKFYDRKEIKDLVAYLRLIQNPVDDVSLKRVLNVPKRGIGARTIEKIQNAANKTGESMFSVLLDDEMIDGFSRRVKKGIGDFVMLITRNGLEKETISVTELIKSVLEESGYMDELKNDDTVEAQSRIENLQEFLSVAMDFEKTSEVKTLEEFLSNISLVSDLDKMEDEDNAVVLMTLMIFH
ncbi:MAG: UvrD-helicase domain-containing protein [Marinisporobacter sp.]|jgi:DNA helicase-2/ATP-dependent DNA helicase PcrA|nr:UvrD-helicase domain-containing protein [Marinisporobacter sp.]